MKSETCVTCHRVMVENFDDLWFMNGQRLPGGPINTVHGKVACSQACKSQHIYSSLGDADREILRDWAKLTYLWFTTTEGCDLSWRLRHPALAVLIGGAQISAADTEIKELLREMAGQEFLDGDADGPEWFHQAVGIVWHKPTLVREKP